MHGDERVGVEDADQVRIPPHADPLPEQGERHRDRTRPRLRRARRCARSARRSVKNGNASAGERLQRPLLDLDEVRPDLAPRRPVNAQPRDRAIPVPEKRILRVEAVEAAALAARCSLT